MKFTENRNAPNCRILAKEYLGCRMKNQLMEQSDWDSLGLINLPGEKTEKHLFSPDQEVKTQPAVPVESTKDLEITSTTK